MAGPQTLYQYIVVDHDRCGVPSHSASGQSVRLRMAGDLDRHDRNACVRAPSADVSGAHCIPLFYGSSANLKVAICVAQLQPTAVTPLRVPCDNRSQKSLVARACALAKSATIGHHSRVDATVSHCVLKVYTSNNLDPWPSQMPSPQRQCLRLPN